MITPDGWLNWAIRLPGPASHTNPGTNEVKGLFMHSAEGYASTLLDPASPYGYNGQHSWHLSNLFDGRVFQHYSFLKRCWHATAANQSYAGCENEGRGADAQGNRLPPGLYEPMNQNQINNAIRFTRDLSEWKGWPPRRPLSLVDITHTLWEHKEVTRLGGIGSQCPSDRINWGVILAGLGDGVMPDNPRVEGYFVVMYDFTGTVPLWRWGSTDGNFPGRVSKNFGGTWMWLRMSDTTINGQRITYWSEIEGD